MNRASSRVEARTPGFFSISDFDPRVSADWHESQASYCVEECNSACLWSFSPGDRPPGELYLEPAAFFGQCNGGVIPLCVVTSSSGLHSKWCLGIVSYLEWTGKSLSSLGHMRGSLSSQSLLERNPTRSAPAQKNKKQKKKHEIPLSS